MSVARRVGARPRRESPPNLGDLARVTAAYRPDVPARYNPVVDEVERWAADEPDALALTFAGSEGLETWSIGDVADAARRAASLLLAAGIGPGRIVALATGRDRDWHRLALGAIRIGAIPVPLPTGLDAGALRVLTARCAPAAVLADADAAAALSLDTELMERVALALVCGNEARQGWTPLETAWAEVDEADLPGSPTAADDPMAMVYTRGTAGAPRLVVHRQSWVIGHLPAARYWLDLRPGDLHWTLAGAHSWTPTWAGLFSPWHERASVLQVGRPALDAATVAQLLAAHEVTSLCATPAQYAALLEHVDGHDLSALRHCVSTGGPLEHSVGRAWRRAVGLPIHEAYGQTETTALVANFRTVARRPGSAGKPVPGWELAIHDAAGAPVPTGTVGRLRVRCPEGRPLPPGLFAGYAGEPVRTSRCFSDGWYDTGDLARVDEDGYFFIVGRGTTPANASDDGTGEELDAGLRRLLATTG